MSKRAVEVTGCRVVLAVQMEAEARAGKGPGQGHAIYAELT